MSVRLVKVTSSSASLEWAWDEDDPTRIRLTFSQTNKGGLELGVLTYNAVIWINNALPARAMELDPDRTDKEIQATLNRMIKTGFNRIEVELGFSTHLGPKNAAGLLSAITLCEAAGLVCDPAALRTLIAAAVGALASAELDEGKKEQIDVLKLEALKEMSGMLLTGKGAGEGLRKLKKHMKDEHGMEDEEEEGPKFHDGWKF